mgnify:FL=1
MPRSELGQRVAVAAVGIPVAIAAIVAGGWYLGVLLAAVAAGSAVELFRLAERGGVRPMRSLGAALAAGSTLIAAAEPSFEGAAGPLFGSAVAVLLLTAGAAVWVRGVEGRPLTSVATTLLGGIFPGWTLAHGMFLRHDYTQAHEAATFGAPGLLASEAWAGAALVVFAVGITWINDSCAYFAGRKWGRRKLIPTVSPGKTVVGAVAGLVGAVVVGAAYAAIELDGWYGFGLGWAAGAVGGLLVGAVAQVGDLAESVLKREAGVKDSGTLFPGHGGFLDRLDALFFAIPVAYWYFAVVIG